MDEPERAPTQFNARELAEQGDTTVRTVHYYVSEGLLPPPEGATRNAVYGYVHLARLKIIAALRNEGLSLAAIRSRLSLLTDEGVTGVLETLDRFEDDVATGSVTALGLIEAAVVDQSSGMVPPPAPEMRVMMSAPPPVEETPPSDSARAYIDRMLRRPEASLAVPPRPVPTARPAPSQETWHHFTIDDGVEIRIREDRLRPDRRQIEAFIQTVHDLARRNIRRRDS